MEYLKTTEVQGKNPHTQKKQQLDENNHSFISNKMEIKHKYDTHKLLVTQKCMTMIYIIIFLKINIWKNSNQKTIKIQKCLTQKNYQQIQNCKLLNRKDNYEPKNYGGIIYT